MIAQVLIDRSDLLVVLAVLVALMANAYFVFRVVPWSEPGPWRLIWLLAMLASAMFILAEAVILTQEGVLAHDARHQFPLFASILSAMAAFFLVYNSAYRNAERERVLGLTDPVSGLPNRRALQERLSIAFERRERFALLYLDLDGFKKVNDQLGHDAGDDVLRGVAGLLKSAVRQADMAARMGGDEFCLLLSQGNAANTTAVAQRILDGLRTMQIPEGIQIGGSFGIATERDGHTPAEVMTAADRAMYEAKRAGGQRVERAAASA